MKIYIVKSEWVYDGERSGRLEVFGTYKKALKQFEAWKKEDEKASKDEAGYIVEDEAGYYSERACVYENSEDGRIKCPTGEDDYEVMIIEREIK